MLSEFKIFANLADGKCYRIVSTIHLFLLLATCVCEMLIQVFYFLQGYMYVFFLICSSSLYILGITFFGHIEGITNNFLLCVVYLFTLFIVSFDKQFLTFPYCVQCHFCQRSGLFLGYFIVLFILSICVPIPLS